MMWYRTAKAALSVSSQKTFKVCNNCLKQLSSKTNSQSQGTLLYKNDDTKVPVLYLKTLLAVQAGLFAFMANTCRRVIDYEDHRDKDDENKRLSRMNYIGAKYAPFLMYGIAVCIPIGGFHFSRRYVKRIFLSANRQKVVIETYDLFRKGHVFNVKRGQVQLSSGDSQLRVQGYRGPFLLGGQIINSRLFDATLM